MMVSATPKMVRVNAIASDAHGIVDYGELRQLDIPRQTIALWARSGHLHRIHEGVYSVVPPEMLTIEGRWIAAVRAAGPGSALAQESGAQLAWLLDRKARVGIHVIVPDRRRLRIPGIIVHRPRLLEPADFTTRNSIPTTTNDRIVWDLAYSARERVVTDVYELADGNDRLDVRRLSRRVREHPHRRGSPLLARLIEEGSVPLATVRSWLETLFTRICSRHDLPRPVINVPFLDYEPDFLWESARFIVEADGGQHMKRSQRDRDNARDIDYQRAGHIVRRYSSRDMKREDEVAEEVLEILIERLRPLNSG